jgi:hypothetical protein
MTLAAQTSAPEPKPKLITVACLDMAGAVWSPACGRRPASWPGC